MAGKLLVHLRNQWIGVIALLLVLTGGTAYALEGSNTVFSDDIVNDEVKSPDVRNDTLTGGGLTDADLRADSVGNSEVQANQITSGDVRDDTLSNGGLMRADLRTGSVRSSEVTNDSLIGEDIEESTLGEVPSATIGGLGRWTGSFPQSDECDPTSTTFIPCATTSLDLAKPSRVLVIGRVGAAAPATADGFGICRIGTTSGTLLDTETPIRVPGKDADNFIETDHTAVVGITGVFPAGSHGFGIDCNEFGGQITYRAYGVAAIGISPN
jgi:hypothetical protein